MNYISIVNWQQTQHYKDRTPSWIKLYNDFLDNYEYACLQDASKSHLIGIMLLASRSENRIPADEKWISSKIGATNEIDLQELIDHGFIVSDQPLSSDSKVLAECSKNQDVTASLEKRREEKRREEKKTPMSSSRSTDVSEIFDYWVLVMGKTAQSRLTDKRRKCIEARLKEGYSVDLIKQAIDGCAASAYHMGLNDSGTVYDDLTLICRTGDKLEQFAGNIGKKPPKHLSASAGETLEQFGARAAQQASRARAMIDDLPD